MINQKLRRHRKKQELRKLADERRERDIADAASQSHQEKLQRLLQDGTRCDDDDSDSDHANDGKKAANVKRLDQPRIQETSYESKGTSNDAWLKTHRSTETRKTNLDFAEKRSSRCSTENDKRKQQSKVCSEINHSQDEVKKAIYFGESLKSRSKVTFRQEIPKNLGLDPTKTSPSSSLSYSQSPDSQSASQLLVKTKRLWDEDDDSSEDEEALFARFNACGSSRKETGAKKDKACDNKPLEKEEGLENGERGQLKTPKNGEDNFDADSKLINEKKSVAIESLTKRSSRQANTDDDLEDLLRTPPKKKSKIRKEETELEKQLRSIIDEPGSPPDNRERRSRSLDDDGSLTPKNPLAASRMIQAESASSQKSTPRNPLALMRQSEARIPLETVQETDPNKTNQTPQPAASLVNGGDELWDDDDDLNQSRDPPSVRKTRAKKATNSEVSRKKPRKKAEKMELAVDTLVVEEEKEHCKTELVSRKKPLKTIEKKEVVVDSIVTEEEKERSKMELYPDFDDPQFGPFEPAEPLMLSYGDISKEERIEVPMSISRFLPKYQRDGILFMYDRIAAGHGAILGDDMVR